MYILHIFYFVNDFDIFFLHVIVGLDPTISCLPFGALRTKPEGNDTFCHCEEHSGVAMTDDSQLQKKCTILFPMENLVIYTDGGCSGNPGPGGWGTVIIDGSNTTKLSGGEKQTTNNRMELSAAINALDAVVKNTAWRSRHVEVYSDSQYVKNGITSWIKNWKKNGWKTAAKKPVLNQDLWIALDNLYNQLDIEWKWVKGHAGVEYNEICDQLCKMEMDKYQ